MEGLPKGVFSIPLGGMVMEVAIVRMVFWRVVRRLQLIAQRDLRLREREQQSRSKELENAKALQFIRKRA